MVEIQVGSRSFNVGCALLELVSLAARLGGLTRLGLDEEGDEEDNGDEGAEQDGKVGGGGHGHALAGEEERAGSLERHLGGDGGGAGSTAGRGELVARAEGAVGVPQGQGSRGREGLRGGEEGNAEECDALHSLIGVPLMLNKTCHTPKKIKFFSFRYFVLL